MDSYRSSEGRLDGSTLPLDNDSSVNRNTDNLNQRLAADHTSAYSYANNKRNQGQQNSSYQDNSNAWSQQQAAMAMPFMMNQGMSGNAGRSSNQNNNAMLFPQNMTPQLLMMNNQQQLQMLNNQQQQQLQMMNNQQQLQMVNGIMPLGMAGFPFSNNNMAMLNVANKVPKKAKKRRKKPKDRPKRPLSAYNLFFKDEREAILNSIPGEEGDDEEEDPPRKNITWPGKKRPPHGKISFESLAKTIGSRWKSLPDKRRDVYKKRAEGDLERYANEMIAYEKKITLQQDEKKKSSKKEDDSEEDEEESVEVPQEKISRKRKKETAVVTDLVSSSNKGSQEMNSNKVQKTNNQGSSNMMNNMGMGMGVYVVALANHNNNNGNQSQEAPMISTDQALVPQNRNSRSGHIGSMNQEAQGFDQGVNRQQQQEMLNRDMMSNYDLSYKSPVTENMHGGQNVQDYSQAQTFNNQAFFNNPEDELNPNDGYGLM